MISLWSKTKAAVNTGYGMNFGRIGLPNPFYKPKPLGMHPELLMEPPYSQDPPVHHMVTRGSGRGRGRVRGSGRLIKGSPEAKARMAKLRAMRGRGGLKSDNEAALRGGDGFFSTLFESLGGTAMNAIKQLALETGASITELLSDPKALIQKLAVFAPAAVSAVRSFFSGKSSKKKKQESQAAYRKKYLAWLRRNDPDAYQKKKKELMRKRLEAYQRRHMHDYDFEDEYEEEPPMPKIPPKRRKVADMTMGDSDDIDLLVDPEYPAPPPPPAKPKPKRRPGSSYWD